MHCPSFAYKVWKAYAYDLYKVQCGGLLKVLEMKEASKPRSFIVYWCPLAKVKPITFIILMQSAVYSKK